MFLDTFKFLANPGKPNLAALWAPRSRASRPGRGCPALARPCAGRFAFLLLLLLSGEAAGRRQRAIPAAAPVSFFSLCPSGTGIISAESC